MKVYAVTGGAGFIGERVVVELLEREPDVAEIRVIDIKWSRKVESDRIGVCYIQCDVTDTRALAGHLQGVSVLFHVAGLVDVFGRHTREELMHANVFGAESVVSACVIAGVKHLVYTSSMEVVGPNSRYEPFVGNEESEYPRSPSSCYACTKALAEQTILRANGRRVSGGGTLRTIALRPTGVYGENDHMMTRFLRRYFSLGRSIPRTICPDACHSRVYVGNVAWMHIVAARRLQRDSCSVSGRVYFCYDGTPAYNYEEFNVELMRGVGVSFSGRTIPYWVLCVLARVNHAVTVLTRMFLRRPVTFTLNPHTLCVANTTFMVCTQKAGQDLDYSPIYSWEESSTRTMAWLQRLAV